MSNSASQDQRRKQWRQDLELAIAQATSPILIRDFMDDYQGSARAVLLRGMDKQTYCVKGQQAGRQIINDQIVARLGILIDAPVGKPEIVDVSAELKEIEPKLDYFSPGTAHATVFIKDCQDDRELSKFSTEQQENRLRFALLCVLYGWVKARDHQFILSVHRPNLVYSVDHGHFFPGGPEWTIKNLDSESSANLDKYLLSACKLTPQSPEIQQALQNLAQVQESQIIQAVASPPKEWNITIEERIAMVEYLVKRQQDLLKLL